MSDFESRLTEALTSGAEDGPAPDRLADGARGRARARRRTRSALVAAGAVVALAVPAGVVALTGDDDGNRDRVATEPPQAQDDWQTVEYRGVLVDVPGTWNCHVGEWGKESCTHADERLNFYASALFDPAHGPGLITVPSPGWSGYVYTGEWAVSVQTAEKRTAQRILASSRDQGQEAPDVSAGFRTVSYDGLAVDVPADWMDGALASWCLEESVPGWVETPETQGADVDCTPPYTGFGVRFNDGSGSSAGFEERGEPRFPEHSWAGVAIVPDEAGEPIGYVEVVAPTRGLAELIGGSLRLE